MLSLFGSVLKGGAKRLCAGVGVAGADSNTVGSAIATAIMVYAVANIAADSAVHVLLANTAAAVSLLVFHFQSTLLF